MTRHRATYAAVLVAALFTLAACSGAGGSDDSEAGSAADVAHTGDAPQAVDEQSAGRSANTATDSGERARPPAMTHAVISKGTVSLYSDDVETTRQDIQRITDSHGGQVSEEETGSDDGETSYVRMVLRIPVAKFGVAMKELEEAGEKRTSNRNTEDVSTQVIDTEVRVRAQRASLKRVEALLARAEKLQDIVWIESQLTTRQAELDSLRQQQLWLDDQTTFSTITVDITRTSAKKAQEEDENGFLAGLKGGMAALGTLGTALATMAGALLPFAVVLAVLGVPVWLLVRRTRRRRAAATAT